VSEPVRSVDRLVGVYHADGGVRGELAYLAGRARGTAHCTLIDITHGFTLSGKRSFKTMAAQLPVPLRLVHRNEQPPALAQLTDGRTPCIIAEVGSEQLIVLGPADLRACDGDVGRFEQVLSAGLADASLRLPPS
jgi:hypothetical protein